MAAISNVTLGIRKTSTPWILMVDYVISDTHHDLQHGQRYIEEVQLLGVDRQLGEDGRDDVLRLLFTANVGFDSGPIPRHHQFSVDPALLNEDPEPLEVDEIQVRVNLVPLPNFPPTRVSNVLRLNEPVLHQ